MLLLTMLMLHNPSVFTVPMGQCAIDGQSSSVPLVVVNSYWNIQPGTALVFDECCID